MTAPQYRDLFALLLDGALYRSDHGDDDALNVPARFMPLFRETLSREEFSRLLEGIELERVTRAASPQPMIDRAIAGDIDVSALLDQAG